MNNPEYPQEFLDRIASVTDKRPKAVLDHILANGQVTTEELKEIYGYNHPPRAARDVRERGIPLETVSVVSSDGRRIGAYRLGSPDALKGIRFGGRRSFSKAFKQALVDRDGARCNLTHEPLEERYLQIDHRIPYEIAGEGDAAPDPADYQLVSGSANRAKSWSCEHCPNMLSPRDPSVCAACYWASPESYTHVATEEARRLDLVWKGEDEVQEHDRLRDMAETDGAELPVYVKEVLRRHTEPSP